MMVQIVSFSITALLGGFFFGFGFQLAKKLLDKIK